jgi:tyrosinase
VSPVAAPVPAQLPSSPLRHRRDARLLSKGQLGDLRRAIAATQAIHDDRGYQYWAGVHGLPLPISCQHHTALFLPWHRAYLYLFEKALQDAVPGVTLPWWDWTVPKGNPPAPYTAKGTAQTPNPLLSSPIQAQGRRSPEEDHTWRESGQLAPLPTAAQLKAVLGNRDFLTFQTQLESLHDNVHIWVGGTMGDISVAAYDPLFWAHHCMIDRVWYLWQLAHPGANPPRNLLDQALSPFPLTVRQTLQIEHLGYDYAAATRATQGPALHG